jgi:hypothetical protein
VQNPAASLLRDRSGPPMKKLKKQVQPGIGMIMVLYWLITIRVALMPVIFQDATHS